jgi:Holliday junction resolvase RusA-like endonuclease
MNAIRFTILGQPCSKANSRQIVTIGGRPQVIKSQDARNYERDALRQIPAVARVRIEGPVRVTLRLFYASERPDLDESIVLDVLQDRYNKTIVGNDGASEKLRTLVQSGVYRNDRQVREKHVYHHIDKANPRAEIEVEPLQPQQGGFDLCEHDALGPIPVTVSRGTKAHA